MNQVPPIEYDDFILGYRNGRLGCAVDVIRVLFLFYSGRVRDRRVATVILGSSIGFLIVLGLSIAGYLFLPLLWAVLTGLVMLAGYVLVGFHMISGAVLSAALGHVEFFEAVQSVGALRVVIDGEGNLPKLGKVVPMRDSRRARR